MNSFSAQEALSSSHELRGGLSEMRSLRGSPPQATLGCFPRLKSWRASFALACAVTFLAVGQVSSVAAPYPQFLGDLDGDGVATVLDLLAIVNHIQGTARLSNELAVFADVNQDGVVNDLDQDIVTQAILGLSSLPTFPLTRILDTSPADNESGVSVTRETIIRFTQPLGANTLVTTTDFYAQFAGQRLVAHVDLSPDHRKLTLFYNYPLPGSARIQVTFNGNPFTDFAGRPLDADGDGQPGGIAVLHFDTLSQTPLSGTVVCGRVFASELAIGTSYGTNVSVNVPLKGVRVTADGLEDRVFAVSDQNGNFKLTNAPPGDFFVHINGHTVTNLALGIRFPDKAYYPEVGKLWRSVAGKETNCGEVYLPLIGAATLQPVSISQPTIITFPTNVLQEHPELNGVSITVPPNSLFSDNSARGGMVGIAPVPPDRLPGPAPGELAFPLVITVQTDGPQNFSQPVPACFPNLPDPVTGEILAPGAKTALWSFNHDTGRWEMRGSATVSEDGKLACTDPGVGILAPGWHGLSPTTTCPSGDCVKANENPNHNPPPPKYASGVNSQYQCPVDPGPTDPVNLYSGELLENYEDLRIKGVGLDFVWQRTYRSYGAEGRRGRRRDSLGTAASSLALNAALAGLNPESGVVTPAAATLATVSLEPPPPPMPLGLGWDHSYHIYLDIYVREDLPLTNATAIGLHDGAGRRDFYNNRNDGTWTILGFFRQFTANPDGTLTLTFEDQTKWNFEVDAGPYREHGRITSIVDRNGNTMRFDYTGDLLTKITDTLGRTFSLAYDKPTNVYDAFPGGPRLISITDFTGRTVRYDYFGPRDLYSKGLLKSVTLPPVTGTPNGNDFPNGKTTTYTYTAEEDKLNSITDARGNLILTNVYSSSLNPRDADWGAVVRQTWGGNLIDITYLHQTPSADNNSAWTKAIVNDRNGNVKEYFYDAGNRCTMMREYTGRANPNSPITETVNRPTGKLRADDPDYFETRYVYNSDSRRTLTVHPNGNITENVYEADLNPAAPARFRGNLREVRHLPGSHVPVGDQASLVEKFEYASDFAGCCGFNFVTKHTDARGNVDLYKYDDHGNLITHADKLPSIVERWEYNARGQVVKHVLPDNGSGSQRVDTMTYYSSGVPTGYLKDETIDADHFKVTTVYERDALGNVTRRIDPRGHDTQFVINQLDQMVREISREVTDGSGVRYRKDYFYDANNNLVRMDVQNINEEGKLNLLNPVFTTTYEYEILNNPIRKTEEVDDSHHVVTEHGYDGNRNRTLTRYGEATAGRQPDNVVQTLYDERDLVLQEIRAPGSPNQSTTQFDYDGNMNRIRSWQGLENGPRLTTYTFDSFNRMVSMLDPMSNVGTNKFDPIGNRTNSVLFGELIDLPGSTKNIRLSETSFAYDALNRLTNQALAFFNATNQAPIGDGLAVTQTIYSDNSQVLAVINDNGHGTTNRYDTANRLQVRLDAKGNTVAYGYDPDSNIITMTENEKPDLGGPDEVFVTTYGYDNLNRLTSTRDNIGNLNRSGYDSRNNRTITIDALTNKVLYAYDGANRLVRTTRVMTDNGNGTGNVIGQIGTKQTWDDSSRLTSQIDDNGNATTYVYDGLNRKFATVFADSTAQTNVFDVHDNAIRFTDGNQNLVNSTFDLNDRLIRKDIVPGPGVARTTTFEVFKYDGLSRLVHAEDNNSLVTRSYDSLSRMTAERQNGQTVASVYDGVGNRTKLSYPTGRVISQTFDALERIKDIAETGGLIASYSYVGPSRVAQRDYGNGTRTAYFYDGMSDVPNLVGDCGVKQIIRTKHSKVGDGTIIDDRSYTWDRVGNRTAQSDLRAGGSTHDYGYDSIYRLSQSIAKPASGAVASISYKLDGAGNRLSLAGSTNSGVYTLSPMLPEPADSQVNQYTTTPFDSRRSDRNGNLSTINAALPSERAFLFDYRNRMVAYTNHSSGVSATYRYDVMGRRIAKRVNGGSAVVKAYFYDNLRICEEQSEAGTLLASYAYGLYVDEVINIRRAETDFYYHCDGFYTLMALSDSSAGLVERYDYDDFGLPSLSTPGGSPLPSSLVSNSYLFTGRYFDWETGLYDYRTRYFEGVSGRFISRDQVGLWKDELSLGNAQSYVGNNPGTRTDPLGLWYVDINLGAFQGGGASFGLKIAPSGLYFYGGPGVGFGQAASATIQFADVTPGTNLKISGTCPLPVAGLVARGSVKFPWETALNSLEDPLNPRNRPDFANPSFSGGFGTGAMKRGSPSVSASMEITAKLVGF